MKLTEYKRKRDFSRTPEPAGKRRAGRHKELSFVVQKHDARRLHYDFRLELDGVLKSWAVPKGPSVDPSRKSLAVEVEDHPLEYGEFEGVIPQGQYGGGTVMLWDRGTWEPLADPHEGLRQGKLLFELHGHKLKGEWTLVRMGPDRAGGKNNWLLMKHRDKYAHSGNGASHDDTARSIKSKRTMQTIAEDADATWNSNGEDHDLPRFAPQLATWVPRPPEGDHWLHEVKFDGYRILADISGKHARLTTRGGKDWTGRFPRVAQELARLRVRNAIVDGEVVVLDQKGRSDFQSLQNAIKQRDTVDPTMFLFDLLYQDGKDLRGKPLIERKTRLEKLLAGRVGPHIKYSEHVRGDGEAVVDAACKMALEGIVSKDVNSKYVSARSMTWLKSKCGHRQEFIIVGYTDPRGTRQEFGALLLGYHDKSGTLQYAGRVGTGFDHRLLKDIKARLKEHQRPTPPTSVPPPPRERRQAHWVAPRLVAEIEFAGWTNDNQLRQASFMGLREDKPTAEVVREDRTPQRVIKRVKGLKNDAAEVSGVRLTHPDRVLFPEEKITKADLAAYYELVAERMLPHVIDRPLTLVRCPEGRTGECFYQRHYSSTMPSAIERAKEGYLMIRDTSGLAAFVQIGALEIHAWGSTNEQLEKPDRLVFDLDPDPSVPSRQVVQTARDLGAMLDSLGLHTFVKTTGGKGLHIVVPIDPTVEWPQAKQFCKSLAEEFARRDPSRYLTVMTKSKRKGKIFIDYLRNGRTATAVVAYSARAREGAPVSTPLNWSELRSLKSGDQFNVKNLPKRLNRKPKDPWAGFDSARVDLHRIVKEAS